MASVCWKDAPKFAIKKFIGSFSESIVNEIYLTKRVDSHPNIIQFHGLTKLQDEKNYSLVLEYAEGGTLGKYLRDDAISFEWDNQLRFAEEIANAILWLHDDVGIIHGDLHPNNILINKGTIKLADFGRSCLKDSKRDNTEVWGVIPYVDPKMFDRETKYILNEKSDIYSLGIIFWEITSRSLPFNYVKKDRITLILEILKGKREEPISGTNAKFMGLYQICWEYEPDKRPDIHKVKSELSSINSDNNNICTVSEKGTSEKIEIEDYDLSNCKIDCDLNAIDFLRS
ncbi:hypothetical protein RclHR1_06020011 [Rhizophagus clarus]|uniref:Protein kinase domain-containing protein n=1 Tax=Rhizophagus clarus TaxID=94130 RepID=A0A2Z6RQF3_9GLOM|nr:hypothetical protein RclHR1_06020011 [Rhizophagus clarus]